MIQHNFTRVSCFVMLGVCPRVVLMMVILLSSAIILAPSSHTVLASSFVVNTLEDNTDDDALCSLREAILAANNTLVNENCGGSSSADDILTFNVSGTVILGAQLPTIIAASIAGALTIDGGAKITISGNDAVRAFSTDTDSDFTIKNLTVSHGHSGSGSFGGGLSINGGRVNIIGSSLN